MMANTTRTMARSATKTMVNDSIAFYPSKTAATKAVKGDSFAFYPTAGATRIPKTSSSNMAIIRSQNQEPAAQFASKYSRAELDSMFATSRMMQQTPKTVSRNQSRVSSSADSFAFYPAGRNSTLNRTTTTNAKDASFGFYPSQGVTRNQKQLVAAAASKPKKPSTSTSTNAQATAEEATDNNMSIFAAGSFAMGLLVQAGRTVARP
jgi:hypothetical protein